MTTTQGDLMGFIPPGTHVTIHMPDDGDPPGRAYGRVVGYHEVDRVDGRAYVYAVDANRTDGIILIGEQEDVEPVLHWESGGTDEPGDQNASSACVEHGHWSLGPQGNGRWGVELIEKYSDLEENPKGLIRLGHFDTERQAKDAAAAYEREHRDDRNIWYVPVLLHIEAKTASGAVDKVHDAIGDGDVIAISGPRFTWTDVYANAPQDTESWGGTELAHTLAKGDVTARKLAPGRTARTFQEARAHETEVTVTVTIE